MKGDTYMIEGRPWAGICREGVFNQTLRLQHVWRVMHFSRCVRECLDPLSRVTPTWLKAPHNISMRESVRQRAVSVKAQRVPFPVP